MKKDRLARCENDSFVKMRMRMRGGGGRGTGCQTKGRY